MQTPLRFTFTLLFLLVAFYSHGQAPYATGLDFNDAGYQQTPKKATLTRALTVLPASASVKQYAPYPKSQLQYGTCVAWSSAYCGRTIVEAVKNNWTDRDFITAHAYSPAFLFRLLQPNDNICKGGAVVEYAFNLMKNTGNVPFSTVSDQCIPTVTPDLLSQAVGSKIKDFVRLFDVSASVNLKIQSVKKSLSEKTPVVIGFSVANSFYTAKDLWQPTEIADVGMPGHAMCVIGYDDNKYGGAFEIQNSWGVTWGNLGYTWVRYADFANFTRYAFEFVDPPVVAPNIADLSGEIKLVLSNKQEMPANLLIATRGLKVVTANKTPEPLTIYKTAQSYTSGTNFRIYISNDQPAYVYAISTDLTNEITKIFPYEEGISAALSYKRNAVAIPDEDHYIQFDNKPGTDYLCVLYSKNELNINQLIAKIAMQTGSFNERVFKALDDKLVTAKNITFSNDKIAFKGFSTGREVIAMMVELDHK